MMFSSAEAGVMWQGQGVFDCEMVNIKNGKVSMITYYIFDYYGGNCLSRIDLQAPALASSTGAGVTGCEDLNRLYLTMHECMNSYNSVRQVSTQRSTQTLPSWITIWNKDEAVITTSK